MSFIVACDDSTRIASNAGYQYCTGSFGGYLNVEGEDPITFMIENLIGPGYPVYYVGKSDDTDNGPFTANPGTKSGTLYFKTPQKGYFVIWLQGSADSSGHSYNSQYLFDGGDVGLSSIDYDTRGVYISQIGGQIGRGPFLQFAALYTLTLPVTADPGPALALRYTVRIAPTLPPTAATPVQFDFWLPDDLNGAALASSSSPHHALDLLMQPTAPGTWASATGMTITAVSVVASGVADPSAAAAGLPTPAGVAGTHYRVEATYQAGAASAAWPIPIGSAAVDDPTTDNPWTGEDPLDRTVAAFGLQVTGAAVPGAAHRRAIVNV